MYHSYVTIAFLLIWNLRVASEQHIVKPQCYHEGDITTIKVYTGKQLQKICMERVRLEKKNYSSQFHYVEAVESDEKEIEKLLDNKLSTVFITVTNSHIDKTPILVIDKDAIHGTAVPDPSVLYSYAGISDKENILYFRIPEKHHGKSATVNLNDTCSIFINLP